MKHIAMLGEGAWGTAVATLLAANDYEVMIWCHDPEVALEIERNHTNSRYLPDVKLSKRIHASTSLKETMRDAVWIFEAIPVKYLRKVLGNAKEYYEPDQRWVILSKGIEKDSLLFPSQILDELYQEHVKKALFAGPSFAKEVARKEVTAVNIASENLDLGYELVCLLKNEFFMPYLISDLMGAQVSAAVKNVITLAIGLLDGARYGDNTKAYFFTRGYHEMILLSQSLGGQLQTMYDLAGIGDLVLTAMGKSSRNLEVGKQLGQGNPLKLILEETGYTPEGINTLKAVYQLAQKQGLSLPLCNGLYQVIFENISGKQFVDNLTSVTWKCP